MHANNEIGTIQPVAELARLAKARGAVVHTDAVQTAGKIPVNVKALGVDLLSLSAHKFYGPKGVGAIWVRRGLRLLPFMTGGKQERGRRAGTENVAGIVGMGVAARLALSHMAEEASAAGGAARPLEQRILAAVPGTAVNGDPGTRVPNTTNISFDRVEAESLLIALDLEGIAVSTGSACSSGTLEPSHVLKAMGLPVHRTQNSIRFSLGSANTEAEVDRVVAVLPGVVDKLRSLTRTPVRGCGLHARRRRHVGRRRLVGRRRDPRGRAGTTSIGLSMQLYDQSGTQAFGSCCSLDDLHDARRVAAAIGIPHYILNFERQFQQTVVANFVGEYLAGRTPLPCAHCNSDLKFSTLLERAQGLGADVVATGHYARVERSAGGAWHLRRGLDPDKDQSYFLFSLTQEQLGARGVSGRRADQARSARACARTRACAWPTSRTARRSASSPTATTPRSWSGRCPRR